MRAIILLATLALAVPSLGQAQGPNWVVDAAKKTKPPISGAPVSDMPGGPPAYVGAWWIGKDGEGADTCTIQLKAPGVIGGYQLAVPKTCAKAVAGWDDLYAWHVGGNGDIVLSDATRRAVYVFHKLDDEAWATEGSDWERLLLQRVPQPKAKPKPKPKPGY